MSKRVKFNEFGIVEPYTFVLATRSHEHLGQIRNIDFSTLVVKENMNAADEISFDCYDKVYQDGMEVVDELWEYIQPLKYIYCVEMEQYFSIDVSLDDTNNVLKKTITATGAAEVELSNINIYGLEINNSNDPNWDSEREEYPATHFYDSDYPRFSLLDRALDRAPQWSIGHVADTLKNLQRDMSADNKNIYDFLTSDVAQQFNCLFLFDSVNRVINVYDLYTTCKCGYRGDFQFTCSKCHDTKIPPSYGEDTNIFVDTETFTDAIQFTTDTASIKNCFHLETGDDTMTSTVREINPTGNNYITYFTQETLDDMPDGLVSRLEEYDKIYAEYYNEHEFELNNTEVSQYNSCIDAYKVRYDGYYKTYNDISKSDNVTVLEQLPNPVISYPELTKYYYQCKDFYYWLRDSMMPNSTMLDAMGLTSEIAYVVTAETEIERINQNFTAGTVIGVNVADSVKLANLSDSQATSAVKNLAKLYAKSGYVKLEVEMDTFGSSISSTTVSTTYSIVNDKGEVTGTGSGSTVCEYRVWTGRIKVINYSDEDNYGYTNNLTLYITNNSEYAIYQKALKGLLNGYEKSNSIYDIIGWDITQAGSEAAFRQALSCYSFYRLDSFADAADGAVSTLSELFLEVDKNKLTNSTFGTAIYRNYQNKLKIILAERDKRDVDLIVVRSILDLFEDLKTEVHNTLSMERFLRGGHEVKYSSQNLIKDTTEDIDLTNGLVRIDKNHISHYVEINNRENVKTISEYEALPASEKSSYEPVPSYYLYNYYGSTNKIAITSDKQVIALNTFNGLLQDDFELTNIPYTNWSIDIIKTNINQRKINIPAADSSLFRKVYDYSTDRAYFSVYHTSNDPTVYRYQTDVVEYETNQNIKLYFGYYSERDGHTFSSDSYKNKSGYLPSVTSDFMRIDTDSRYYMDISNEDRHSKYGSPDYIGMSFYDWQKNIITSTMYPYQVNTKYSFNMPYSATYFRIVMLNTNLKTTVEVPLHSLSKSKKQEVTYVSEKYNVSNKDIWINGGTIKAYDSTLKEWVPICTCSNLWNNVNTIYTNLPSYANLGDVFFCTYSGISGFEKGNIYYYQNAWQNVTTNPDFAWIKTYVASNVSYVSYVTELDSYKNAYEVEYNSCVSAAALLKDSNLNSLRQAYTNAVNTMRNSYPLTRDIVNDGDYKISDPTALVNLFNAIDSAKQAFLVRYNAINSTHINGDGLTEYTIAKGTIIYSLVFNRGASINKDITIGSGTWTETKWSIAQIEDFIANDFFDIFCVYRRDDNYQNSNYISDGLTTAKLVANAKEFLEKANTELKKAATPQHTISTSLHNLLIMPEFEPLLGKFKIGNFIRVRIGQSQEVYRLRLISYSISWGSLQTLDVEFSDLIITPDVTTDIQSILNQASSIAGSYNYVENKVEEGSSAKTTITNWIKDGLNSALVNISNNNNEEVIFNEAGITARTFNEGDDDYDGEQLRITHNILCFTEDNWNTVSCALGKHKYKYYNGSGFVEKTGYGLTSDFVTSGHIYGTEIISGDIYSSSYSQGSYGTHIGLTNNTFEFYRSGNSFKLNSSGVVFSTGGGTLSWDGSVFKVGNSSAYMTWDSTNGLIVSGTITGSVFKSGTNDSTYTTLPSFQIEKNGTIIGGHIYSHSYYATKEDPHPLGMFIDLDSNYIYQGKKYSWGGIDYIGFVHMMDGSIYNHSYDYIAGTVYSYIISFEDDGDIYMAKHNPNGTLAFLAEIGVYGLHLQNGSRSSIIDLSSEDGTGYFSGRITCEGLYSHSDNTFYKKTNMNEAIISTLTVTRTKSRQVTTETYNDRLLYCYETPEPLFGDVGEGLLDETGKCYIFIDDIFYETIANNIKYQVFLQKYGDGDCYVTERTPSYFIVEGTPNLSFGWEIKGNQVDSTLVRIEEPDYNKIIEEDIDIKA